MEVIFFVEMLEEEKNLLQKLEILSNNVPFARFIRLNKNADIQ